MGNTFLKLCTLVTLVTAATAYHDGVVEGAGDAELLSLLSYARRSLGEADAAQADAEFQTMPMLFSGGEDGLLEGPTWSAYWTQNSYGTAMGALPFLGAVGFKGMRESQNWWFNNMANGSNAQYAPGGGWAPDGASCDNGSPSGCNYKQGDGNVAAHDWTVEETLSGVVMQAELLLISRNASAARAFLPQALRTSNMVEARRDPASDYLAFLTGPASNLLAPSFGAWRLDNGRHAWSWMTGIVVTYAGALLRLVELARMEGCRDAHLEAIFAERLRQCEVGLASGLFTAPGAAYFMRSVDPNGTLHGVVGQARHGYFEAAPNHDAVALRVVNASTAAALVGAIKSMGAKLRPNVFILPNTDATGKDSNNHSGAIGYDDMPGGVSTGGLFRFGEWVNGGVWTTTEGRWILAAARTGDLDPGFQSVRQMLKLFGSSWRMDNPITNFGLEPYQPDEDINLTVDNFASAAALLRGLFEYVYDATSLTLLPHGPDNVTSLQMPGFGARWGPYRVAVTTTGVRSSGIASVTVDGLPLAAPHAFNATAVSLAFAAMPAPSVASAAAVNSTFRTAATTVTVAITFRTFPREETAAAHVTSHDASPPPAADYSFDCVKLRATTGPDAATTAKLTAFANATGPAGTELSQTLAHAMCQQALAYASGFEVRCAALNNGTFAPLRKVAASKASLVQMLTTSASLATGLDNHIVHTIARESASDPLAAQLLALWH